MTLEKDFSLLWLQHVLAHKHSATSARRRAVEGQTSPISTKGSGPLLEVGMFCARDPTYQLISQWYLAGFRWSFFSLSPRFVSMLHTEGQHNPDNLQATIWTNKFNWKSLLPKGIIIDSCLKDVVWFWCSVFEFKANLKPSSFKSVIIKLRIAINTHKVITCSYVSSNKLVRKWNKSALV
jgi:hypothetical protein